MYFLFIAPILCSLARAAAAAQIRRAHLLGTSRLMRIVFIKAVSNYNRRAAEATAAAAAEAKQKRLLALRNLCGCAQPLQISFLRSSHAVSTHLRHSQINEKSHVTWASPGSTRRRHRSTSCCWTVWRPRSDTTPKLIPSVRANELQPTWARRRATVVVFGWNYGSVGLSAAEDTRAHSGGAEVRPRCGPPLPPNDHTGRTSVAPTTRPTQVRRRAVALGHSDKRRGAWRSC